MRTLSVTWSIKSLLNWTTDYLAKKGTAPSSARLEAQILLAHVLKCKKIDLLIRFDEEPSEADRTSYRELITRRVQGWPVAYLVGFREFHLLEFEVSPAVLVPRPETEVLVAEALRLLATMTSPQVLDLGTGSGCIAISIAQQKKDTRVMAIDISPDALDIARRNAARHGVADRIDFVQGDLFAPIPTGTMFDLIVSNPPYVTSEEMAKLEPDVREFEPNLALDGGPDGLAFYRRIAADCVSYLKHASSLLVEIGSTQEDSVTQLFTGRPELSGVRTLKDGSKWPRVVVAQHLAR